MLVLPTLTERLLSKKEKEKFTYRPSTPVKTNIYPTGLVYFGSDIHFYLRVCIFGSVVGQIWGGSIIARRRVWFYSMCIRRNLLKTLYFWLGTFLLHLDLLFKPWSERPMGERMEVGAEEGLGGRREQKK